MNSGRNRRRGIWLASLPLTSLCLLVTGCGANAKSPSVAVTDSSRSAIQPLLAYSACMRKNGVPSFPDPNGAGNLVLTPNTKINPASPQYERALVTCKNLGPAGASGEGMTPAQHAKALTALTRYVACMRAHAIPMADPFSGPNGGVGIVLPRSVDPSSEQYDQADAACKHLLPSTG
jgi:hypothetical protein